MPPRRALLVVVLAVVSPLLPALTATAGASPPAARPTSGPYQNCGTLQKTHPHGLGRVGATDRTAGKPVTTFTRSTKLYDAAITANRDLDRDRDGVACEKR